MRPLAALLGLMWAVGNLFVAYVFVMSGLTDKATAKGPMQVFLLVSAGATIALFALILAGQSLMLAISREKATTSSGQSAG